MKRAHTKKRSANGFTLVELLVTVGIFVFMTALIVARYGAFNQGTLLTNTAYDIAMTIRLAQTYSISVAQTSNQSYNGPGNSFTDFSSAFAIQVAVANAQHNFGSAGVTSGSTFVLFQDFNHNGMYDVGESIPGLYTLKGGAQITNIQYCMYGSTCASGPSFAYADISFRRPNPEAIIFASPSFNANGNAENQHTGGYLVITVTSADGTATRNVLVQGNGEISVQ